MPPLWPPPSSTRGVTSLSHRSHLSCFLHVYHTNPLSFLFSFSPCILSFLICYTFTNNHFISSADLYLLLGKALATPYHSCPRPPPCSSCLSTTMATTGCRSSFPSSHTSHYSFFAPSVFDKVKSAWTTFFSKFGFGKGKDKEEATLLSASPNANEGFFSFVSSLAPYPVSTRVSWYRCHINLA